MSSRIDRRRFLLGAGGVALALPMLEAFAPREGFANTATPPKRLLIVHHEHGRIVGNGKGDNVDWWSPGAKSGALPANGTAASKMLAALAPINDRIVTFDGIDDIIR